MPKLQYDSGNDRYNITVPKEMVVLKKWSKGQSLFFVWNERGNIEIKDGVK